MKIITREQAKEQGLVRYFTGVECVNGHLAERNTKSSKCIMCVRATARKWENGNADRKDKKSTNAQKYREENKEQLAEYMKNWKENNRDKVRANQAKYRTTTNGKMVDKAKNRKRRHTIKSTSDGSINVASLNDLIDKQGFLCNHCSKKLSDTDMQLDHIVPLARGGTHILSNVQFLCSKCNLKKHSKLESEL